MFIKLLNLIFLVLISLILLLDDTTFNQFHKTLFSDNSDNSDISKRMETLNQVDIDSLGRFKYVLVKVLDTKTQNTRIIVRGFQWADYHIDLMENFGTILRASGMDHLAYSCLGGGRIYHNPDKKTIKIYGVSEQFGRADHKIAYDLIKEKFPDYDVSYEKNEEEDE